MSSISSINGAAFLQTMASSTASGGNWMQDAANATSSGADWMDPSASSGSDATSLAANAFAAAQQLQIANKGNMAVNTGISVLSAQLTGSVNILA
jgi:hypothetical protein